MNEYLLTIFLFCLDRRVYILGALGWLAIILSYPVGSQLPVYAEY